MSFPQETSHNNSQYHVGDYQMVNNSQYPPVTSHNHAPNANFQGNYATTQPNHQYIAQDDYVLQDLDSRPHTYEQNVPMEVDTISQSINDTVQNVPAPRPRVPIRRFAPCPHRADNMMLIDTKKFVEDFWVMQKRKMESLTEDEIKEKCKHMPLPQARVKKIMRIDEDVRALMISGDAPLFLAAAAEIFIEEITALAWHVVEESRRRTMQKSDIILALQRFDQFDFLIDLIPRDANERRATSSQEVKPPTENNQFQTYPNVDQNGHHQQHQNQPHQSTSNVQYSQQQEAPNVHNQVYMRPPDTITITLDEHGNPIGDLPPGVQIVVQRNEDGGEEYQVIQNGNRNIEFRQVNRYEHEQAQRVNFRVDGAPLPSQIGHFNR